MSEKWENRKKNRRADEGVREGEIWKETKDLELREFGLTHY